MKKSTAAVLAGTITMAALAAAYLTSPTYRSDKLAREIAALERAVAADAAALQVERAECATSAREFGATMATACWRAYAVQAETVARSREAAHRRLAQLEAERDALR